MGNKQEAALLSPRLPSDIWLSLPQPLKASRADPTESQSLLKKFLTILFLEQFLIHRKIEKVVQIIVPVLSYKCFPYC